MKLQICSSSLQLTQALVVPAQKLHTAQAVTQSLYPVQTEPITPFHNSLNVLNVQRVTTAQVVFQTLLLIDVLQDFIVLTVSTDLVQGIPII